MDVAWLAGTVGREMSCRVFPLTGIESFPVDVSGGP